MRSHLFRVRHLPRLEALRGLLLTLLLLAASGVVAQDAVFRNGFEDDGTGFLTRPFLFQADRERLLASIAGNDPEATGPIVNELGEPMGFITLANAALANRNSFSDVPTWQLAFAGWLVNQRTPANVALLNLAKNETMALVRSQPGGISGTGEAYQHTEDYLLDVAAVADLAHSRFTPSELQEVATWVNGTLTNWIFQNNNFWPFDDPLNNYWQNGFLGFVIGGIATQGFNEAIKPGTSPPVTWSQFWRNEALRMANVYIAEATPPLWNGPVQAEGHYYSTYVRNAIWAMTLHDNVLGTDLISESNTSGPALLDMLMYEVRPHLEHFFLLGSETGSGTNGPFGHTTLSYWHQLITMSPASPQSGHAKSILQVAMLVDDSFWYRGAKGFFNFYYNIRGVPALPLSGKTDRMNVAGTPGAGLIGIRSAAGFATNARAAMMFANHFGYSARWSHSNPDAPGFQWCSGADWLVTDPEAFGPSGILAEAGGIGSDISNIVTINGVTDHTDEESRYPRIIFAEDNRSAPVPHFYAQIDAQPYWNTDSVPVTTMRRDYVWLDDLQVVVIHDQVAAAPGKAWRLHVPTQPTVFGANVSYTINGKTVTVRDVYSPGAAAWSVTNLNGSPGINQNVYRIRQNNTTANYQSVKVLDVGGRVTAASATTGAGTIVASLTVGGISRTVTFFTNGNHAQVQ